MNLFRRDPEAKKRRLEKRLRSVLKEADELTREIVSKTEPVILPEKDRFEFNEVPPPSEHWPLQNNRQIPIVYTQRFTLEFGKLEEKFQSRVTRSVWHYAKHDDHNLPLRKKTAGIKPVNCYFIKVGDIFTVIYQMLDRKVKFLSIVKRQ